MKGSHTIVPVFFFTIAKWFNSRNSLTYLITANVSRKKDSSHSSKPLSKQLISSVDRDSSIKLNKIFGNILTMNKFRIKQTYTPNSQAESTVYNYTSNSAKQSGFFWCWPTKTLSKDFNGRTRGEFILHQIIALC